MTPQQIHELLVEKFKDVIESANLESLEPQITVKPAAIADVCQFLKSDERLQMRHLNNLCGVDYFDPKSGTGRVEVVYHMQSYTLRHRICIKVSLPRSGDGPNGLPTCPSVSKIWDVANWHEREAFDLVGIHFEGHPKLVRILCDEGWEGHPLRKDYVFPTHYQGMRAN